MALSAASQAFAGLASLVISRRLSANVFGYFALLYGLGLVLSAGIDFGSTQARARDLARTGDLPAFRRWLKARVVTHSVALLLVVVCTPLWYRNDLSLVAALLLTGQVLTYCVGSAVVAGVNSLRGSTAAMLSLAAGNVGYLLTCLATNGSRVWLAAAGASVSWILTALVGGFALRKGLSEPPAAVPYPRPLATEIRESWRGAAPFGFTNLAYTSIYLDVTMLALVSGLSAAAVLGAVHRWTAPIVLFGAVTNLLIFPGLVRDSTLVLARRRLRRVVPIPLCGSALALGLAVMAPFVTRWLLGSRYPHADLSLRWLCVGAALSAWVPVFVTFLQARGREAAGAHSVLAGAGVRLVGITLLGYMWGAAGAAAASVVGAAVSILLLLLEYRNLVREPTGRAMAGSPEAPSQNN